MDTDNKPRCEGRHRHPFDLDKGDRAVIVARDEPAVTSLPAAVDRAVVIAQNTGIRRRVSLHRGPVFRGGVFYIQAVDQ